jgi:hypothetical protein
LPIVPISDLFIDPEGRHAVNCYMCDSTGRAAAAVAICHHCGVALCREHLDDDLLSSRPLGHIQGGCTHHLHGAAMARRQARPPAGASPPIDRDRQFSGRESANRLPPRQLRRRLYGRLIPKGGDVATLRTCYLVAVACHARLRTRAPLGVLIVEGSALLKEPWCLPSPLSTAARSCDLWAEVMAGIEPSRLLRIA